MGNRRSMGRKRKTKREIIVLASIVAFLIAGCGKGEESGGQGLPGIAVDLESLGTGESLGTDEGKGSSGGQASQEDQEWKGGPVTWQPTYVQLEKPYTQILADDHTLYGYYTESGQMMLDNIEKESLSANADFSAKTVLLPHIDIYSGIAADQEGYAYFLEAGEGDVWLCRIAPRADASVPEKIELKDSQDVGDMRLKAVMADERGYLYIWCGLSIPRTERIDGVDCQIWSEADRVYVMNRQWETLFYEEILDVSGVQVLCFQIGPDGTPFFLLKDDLEICVQEIDVERQQGKEKLSLGSTLDCFDMQDANIPEHMAYTGSGWVYCRNGWLLEFRQDTMEKTQILNLASDGILSEDILFLTKKEDKIEIIDRDAETGILEYIVFAPGTSDKKTVTLGVTFMAQDLEKAVAEFNRSSTGYKVEIVDYYSRTGDYDEASEQLKLALVTGKAPDIIAVSGMDYQMFTGKAVLADLYGFMEDGECSKDMLVESVARACEDQGHLYSIAPSFQLHTMWGYSDVTGGRSGVTFSQLLEILQDNGKDFNAIGGFSADEPVLSWLCAVAMDEFVDWETGSCAFDGDYFKEVLSFAGAYSPEHMESSYSERIRSRVQVMTVGILTSVAEYQIQKQLYGGELSFIGYPAAEGSGTVVDYQASAVGINAGGEEQEGAWAFVKFYLLKGYDGQGFPVVKQQFERAMEDAMQDDYAAAEGGGREKLPKGYYSDGDNQIFAYAATKEEVDAIRGLVDQVENRLKYHRAIEKIINEEAQGFLSGQVDLDRTAEKIQNRASILLQESR